MCDIPDVDEPYLYDVDEDLIIKIIEYNEREQIKKTNKRLKILYEILTDCGLPENIQRIIAMKLYGIADKLDLPKRVKFTKDEWHKIDPDYNKKCWEAIYK
jgi:hypothetical protein